LFSVCFGTDIFSCFRYQIVNEVKTGKMIAEILHKVAEFEPIRRNKNAKN